MRGVEGVLLIPTSAEAEHLLSDSSRVPANCQRGWTQKGEDFYPDPNYKSYGGKVGRPKYLQVSTKDAIQLVLFLDFPLASILVNSFCSYKIFLCLF